MSDLLDKLRRYAEALRALELFRFDTPEFKRARVTLDELRPCLRVALDIVVGPDGAEYTISTANRETSAIAAAGHWYAETMVFRVDDSVSHEVRMVWQGEAAAGSTATHERAVDLVKSGRIEAAGEDEG